MVLRIIIKMEDFGAIVGCYYIPRHRYLQLHNSRIEDRGIDARMIPLNHNVALLQNLRIFSAAAQSEQILFTDKFLLNESYLTLQPSLDHIHSTIVQRKISALTASPATKAVDKVHSFLYGKTEMQGISKDLLQWTERYHVRFGLLPFGLQTRPKSEHYFGWTAQVRADGHTSSGNAFFTAFGFIYQVPKLAVIPDDATDTTLLDLIATTSPAPNKPGGIKLIPPKHPLEQRFELARKITSAVMYVHVMQYVHKSIQTSNIVMFAKNDASTANTEQFPKALGEPFLCGFETSRYDRGASDYGQYDVAWEYDIYRHPKRQGLHPESRYTMNHDLYSLGVVLLELGLWRPLRVMGLRNPDSISGSVKDHLKKLAITGLPCMMGTKYRDVVLFCLDIDGDGQISNSTAVEEVLKKVEEMAIGLQ
ncbi:uncharacterized protein FTJAE_2401 [Fusarium tjaetaba]|uniref:Protein kinase domain-containing protein n=1 Tax=Fusarium tjaetaba TaxID=1567544 RepID=A0A8H5S3L9_9HYPO|nr:uncharacterized protein FTJAE_2401 [Fusarium tjaetaba]KAF5645971.1 hypothetical protein FTJAE_2401 [Fusarium tjaetaba]